VSGVRGRVDLEFGMGNLERSSEKLGSQEVERSKEKFTAQDAKNTERFEAESKAHRAKRSRSWEAGKVGDRRTEGSGLQRR